MSDDKTDLTKLQHSDIEEPGPADVVTQELAYLKPPIHHPHPQPHLGVPEQETKGDTTYVTTCPGIFSELDPFCYPPGTNNLPTIYTNVFDSSGKEIPHTLPSTPQEPYNLHDGEPDVTKIEPTSPTDDLYETFAHLADTIIGVSAHSYWAKFGDCTQVEVGDTLSGQQIDAAHVKAHLQRAIDILEGNPVPDRVYSGFPLLHYNGPHKIKAVKPIEDGLGKIIGGNVAVHQIWYDSHIESDTAFLDLSKLKDKNGEWIKDKACLE